MGTGEFCTVSAPDWGNVSKRQPGAGSGKFQLGTRCNASCRSSTAGMQDNLHHTSAVPLSRCAPYHLLLPSTSEVRWRAACQWTLLSDSAMVRQGMAHHHSSIHCTCDIACPVCGSELGAVCARWSDRKHTQAVHSSSPSVRQPPAR